MPAGRPIKPTALKILQGTARPSRLNADEPQMPIEYPEAPEYLQPDEREAWDRLRPVLERMRIVTAADFLAIEALARNVALTCRVYKSLHARKNEDGSGGVLYETEMQSGSTNFHSWPEFQVLADLDRRQNMWLQQFGMSPSTRAKVKATLLEEEEDDPDAEFGRRG